MKQITSDEFQKAIELDPAWASKLTEPIEVTDYCDMGGSKITHLSPLLHFMGRDDGGNCASFVWCENLKVCEGTFNGFVAFCHTGIEKIGELTILQGDVDHDTASFEECKNLKTAEGTFPGWVGFQNSGVETIGNLVITRAANNGNAIRFDHCPALKKAHGTYPGCVDFYKSGIKRIEKLSITHANEEGEIANFMECNDLILPKEWLEKAGVRIGDDLRARSEIQLQHEAAARKAMKQPSFEL